MRINIKTIFGSVAKNGSFNVDETYIKVKGEWKYLYRAINSDGNTIDFLLTAQRDTKAAKRFLQKALRQNHSSTPRVINTNKDKAYPKAIKELKESRLLPESVEHRAVKYLNNLIEQDHRYTKLRVIIPILKTSKNDRNAEMIVYSQFRSTKSPVTFENW
jgi:transposase, IS6 family